jgi:hypothetical protein
MRRIPNTHCIVSAALQLHQGHASPRNSRLPVKHDRLCISAEARGKVKDGL